MSLCELFGLSTKDSERREPINIVKVSLRSKFVSFQNIFRRSRNYFPQCDRKDVREKVKDAASYSPS